MALTPYRRTAMITLRLAPALLALLLAGPLAAQAVSGRFVDPAGEPVPSARVTLRDESGRAVQSTLTDAAGQFTLRASAPGRWVVRAERIGYASTVSDPLQLDAGQEATLRLVANGERVMLEAIVVEGQPRCALRPGVTEETALVWGEARKALDLVNANTQAPLVAYTLELFEREIESPSGMITVNNVRRVNGLAHKPFVPVAPERLAAQGYIERDSGAISYAAPDADVLLSDQFLEDHCFRLRTQNAPQPGLIGLQFEPARGRRVPDVQGVLWLDRATAELRSMEFEYTRAPLRGPRGVPGGKMDFQRLPNGRWITTSWVVRMPVEADRADMNLLVPRGPQVAAVREVGGGVLPAGSALAVAPAAAPPPVERVAVADSAAPPAAVAAAGPAPAAPAATQAAVSAQEGVRLASRQPGAVTDRRRRIGVEEIEQARVSSAFELVQVLRPNWLRPRGSNVIRQGTMQTIQGPIDGLQDEAPIVVYVDGRRSGTLEVLRTIAHGDVYQIEYYDPIEAQQRWGANNTSGAIQVILKRS